MRNWSAAIGLSLILFSGRASARLAPFFNADAIDGKPVVLESYLKPKRVVLLSFWATWCNPCLEELKSVSEALKADPKIPIDVITVNVDTTETKSDVKPTVRMYEFSFPVILDTKHEIFSSYRADQSLPFSVVIDSSGNIIETFNGYSESMVKRLKEIAAAASGPNAT